MRLCNEPKVGYFSIANIELVTSLIVVEGCYLHHSNILSGVLLIGNCTAGYARQEEIGSPGECAPCAVGSYSPKPRMDDCIPCDQHRSTSREGSTSAQECQCKFLIIFEINFAL